MSPLELMASIIAAACHDLDHPGKNEKFLIATSSHLAGMYDNSSVLENHHWRSAVACLWESGLMESLSREDQSRMVAIVQEVILATDISRQQEFLAQFASLLEDAEDGGPEDLTATEENRLLVLQIAMKCADISNPCRSWNISRLWSYRACEEFFRQGDAEKRLGFQEITPICDRDSITVAKASSYKS